ncbi:Uncharacterized protein BM_BM11779 [Brugia malayi]|uniref:Sodium/hydrogen exchanger n=2 Tax=Onchocercidae TaxID=6296 RepID=A0A4E9F1S3_BRUMA|nr:Uncharacterized protein BM_BM11779 [Brugia malayi]VIO89977.1 Uncharacterized protein BM_BM11779 [Brugia malayi]
MVWFIMEFQWHDLNTPLSICIWLLSIILIKILSHSSKRLTIVPDSALLILVGFAAGSIMDRFWPHEIYLHPDFFFLYLLPPIALDAGYALPNQAFFENFGTIILYAVVGTIWNIFSVGFFLFMASPFFSVTLPWLDLFLFSTFISAVDPVAVLSVFEEIKVNRLLYICVFGESLLNDAVTIVMYHALAAMVKIGPENLEMEDFIKALISFFLVSFGGILIGIVGAALTGLATKYSNKQQVLQPLICLLIPYLSYLIAESVHFSGILAIVLCGLMMKQYLAGNLSKESLVTTSYFLKTLSTSCEAIIFVFLGLSTVSKRHDWNSVFIGTTLLACLVCRFTGTYFLTCLANRGRRQKINFVDQFIMAYGGLRGAICYGLVMTLDKDAVLAKEMFASTTIIVILTTVFLQGATIKPLVKLLDVEIEPDNQETLVEQIISDVRDDIMEGIEAVAGIQGPQWFRHKLSHFNNDYILPCMVRNQRTRADELLTFYDKE